MKVELNVTIRGEERVLVWEDGVLTGDDEVRARMSAPADAARKTTEDLVEVINEIEAVTAQHVTFSMVEAAEEPVSSLPVPGRARP